MKVEFKGLDTFWLKPESEHERLLLQLFVEQFPHRRFYVSHQNAYQETQMKIDTWQEGEL